MQSCMRKNGCMLDCIYDKIIRWNKIRNKRECWGNIYVEVISKVKIIVKIDLGDLDMKGDLWDICYRIIRKNVKYF